MFRFLEVTVSQIIYKYLTYIRPMELVLLEHLCFIKNLNENDSRRKYSENIFCYDGICFTSKTFANSFEKVMREYLDLTMNISSFRYFYTFDFIFGLTLDK